MTPPQPVAAPPAVPPRIANRAPPASWHLPEVIIAEPAAPPTVNEPHGSDPASVGLIAATTFVWLVAIVLGTLAALMARE